jgi:uncharacterized protein
LADVSPLPPLDGPDFDALEDILDDLRTRGEDVPQWEFLEGAMAALLCTRRAIPAAEYLPVLLGVDEADPEATRFADEAQAQRFEALWTRRWNEVAQALAAEVKALDDEQAYHPEVMDVRGAVAMLADEARAEMADQALPAYGQVWALGFMFVVENWPEEWEPPRDKETAGWIDEALDAIVAITEDDTAQPAFNLHAEEGPPSVSEARANAFGSALWAVYDLRQIWQSLGERAEPVRKSAEPGRNDPCPCGSGKKYKKCHGA